MVECVVVERLRPNMGRNQNKTYVNVVVDARQFSIGTTLADWLAANPGHPWNDLGFNEFVVEVTLAEYNDFIAIGDDPPVNPLFHGPLANVLNEPRWQQQNEGSGSVKALGSFADPESALSAFTVDVPLPDDRWIVRVYTASDRTGQVSAEEFDEGAAGATVERFIGLFNSDDTENTTNAGNQRTEIGGKLIDFDFGSSDGLPGGVARLQLAIDRAGRGDFFSNHRYRVLTLTGEDYSWAVFGKKIEVNVE
jgi:hypothetical protein